MFLAERPDGVSSCTRKIVHTTECSADFPNAFHVGGKCGAHQCHRCIQCIERLSAGDAHACVVSCAHPSHMLALQRSLKVLLEPRQGLIRHLAPPPPEFRERNVACVKCTLARRSELITSDVQVDRSHSERCLEQDQDICCAPLTKFLAMWNGDWSSPVVEH